ncbi:MAG TPA: hypothetical protein VLL52_09995, partial [Anaerolineae bacterium]|nr:hypothetical protein [Anaerolineae bacterium]
TWHLSTHTLIHNQDGHTLWHQPTPNQPWQLPGGPVNQPVPPWLSAQTQTEAQLAIPITITHLHHILINSHQATITFIFGANTTAPLPTNHQFFSPTAPPTPTLPYQAPYTIPSTNTQFHLIS